MAKGTSVILILFIKVFIICSSNPSSRFPIPPTTATSFANNGIEDPAGENETELIESPSFSAPTEISLLEHQLSMDPETLENLILTEIENNSRSSQVETQKIENEVLVEEEVKIIEKLPEGEQNVQHVKQRAIENLMKIFGLQDSSIRDNSSPGPPPEFMIDLYNTITDSYGVTRARNPYDAHVVRSFIERDNSLNDYFFFNISGLEESESVLEAELHAHRMRTPHESLHPSLYLTPFYILSLYQVVDPKNLDIPDLHKLLGVHYVPALGSGWEVFNVKQAVLDWIKGEDTNHGFLIAATSLSGERVPVRFSRRGETQHSKQPILVLFNQDSKIRMINKKMEMVGKPYVPENSEQKPDNEDTTLQPSSLENPRFHHALLFKDSVRHPNSVSRFRSRRSKNNTETVEDSIAHGLINRTLTECGRHDLFVSFEAIGWSSWIISPKGYNAFHCDGPCSFPLGQQVKPTNHATVQSIVQELNLSPGVKRPCCVPTTLLPISLLYYDDHDNVVLKQYVDMVAETCGCH